VSRELTTDVGNAVVADEVRPAFFVHLALDSGDVRVWNGAAEYELDGETFQGVGHLGGISPVEESTRVTARGIELSLSGIDSSMVSIALAERYRGRRVTIWLAFFDEDFALIADPVQHFSGFLDTMSLQEDGGSTSTITITAESRLIDLERPRESRLTNEEQQRLYPGDLGLEYVAGLADKALPWGVPASSATSSSAPSNPSPRLAL
jgi:hypothetical protein